MFLLYNKTDTIALSRMAKDMSDKKHNLSNVNERLTRDKRILCLGCVREISRRKNRFIEDSEGLFSEQMEASNMIKDLSNVVLVYLCPSVSLSPFSLPFLSSVKVELPMLQD